MEERISAREKRLKKLYQEEFARNQAYANQSKTHRSTRPYNDSNKSRPLRTKAYCTDSIIGRYVEWYSKFTPKTPYYNNVDLLITLINAWICEAHLEEHGIIVDVLTESVRWREQGNDQDQEALHDPEVQCANDIKKIFNEAKQRFIKNGKPHLLVLPLLHHDRYMAYVIDLKNKTCLGFEPCGGVPGYPAQADGSAPQPIKHLIEFEQSLRKQGFSTYHSHVKQQSKDEDGPWLLVESIIEILNGYAKTKDMTLPANGVHSENQKISYIRPTHADDLTAPAPPSDDLTTGPHQRKLTLLKLRLMNLNNRHCGEAGDLTGEKMLFTFTDKNRKLVYPSLCNFICRETRPFSKGDAIDSGYEREKELFKLAQQKRVEFMQFIENLTLDEHMESLFVYFFTGPKKSGYIEPRFQYGEDMIWEPLIKGIPSEELYPRLFYLYYSALPLVIDKEAFKKDFTRGANLLVRYKLEQQEADIKTAKKWALLKTVGWCLLIVPIVFSSRIYNHYKQKHMPQLYFEAISPPDHWKSSSNDDLPFDQSGTLKAFLYTQEYKKGYRPSTPNLHKKWGYNEPHIIGARDQIKRIQNDNSASTFKSDTKTMAHSIHRLFPRWAYQRLEESSHLEDPFVDNEDSSVEDESQYKSLFKQVNKADKKSFQATSACKVDLKK